MKKLKLSLEDKLKQKALYEEALGVDFADDSAQEFMRKKYFGKITGSFKAAVTGMFDLKTRCELDEMILNKYEKVALYLGKIKGNNQFALEEGTNVYDSGKISMAVNGSIYFFAPVVALTCAAYKVNPLASGLGLFAGMAVGVFAADMSTSGREYAHELLLSHKIERDECSERFEFFTRNHMIEGESTFGSIYKKIN